MGIKKEFLLREIKRYMKRKGGNPSLKEVSGAWDSLCYLEERGFLNFSDQPEIVFEEVEEICNLKNESKKE